MVVLLKGEKIYFRLLLTLEENDCDKEIYDEELWDSKKKKKEGRFLKYVRGKGRMAFHRMRFGSVIFLFSMIRLVFKRAPHNTLTPPFRNKKPSPLLLLSFALSFSHQIQQTFLSNVNLQNLG